MKYLCILSGSTYVLVQHKIRISVFCTLKRPNSKIFLNFWYYYNWSRFFSCYTFDSPCGGMKTIRQTHTTKAHLEGTFSVFLPKLISSYIQKLFENLDACFSYYFFHPDNAIAFFCVKSWCCTVHQKSNILFKKSTFFSFKFQNNCWKDYSKSTQRLN